MVIFLRYILNSMKEKKIREVLLLFAIALSSGLLFGTLVWSKSFSNNLEQIYKEYYEGSNIYFDSNTEDSFFRLDEVNTDGLQNVIPEIRIIANNYDFDDDLHINVIARDNIYNKMELIQGKLPDNNKNEAVISERISKKLNLSVNDKLSLFLGGTTKDVIISGIAANNDCFIQDSIIECVVLLPYKYLSKELDLSDRYNFVRANTDANYLQDNIDYFQKNNLGFSAKMLYSQEDIDVQVNKTVNTYYLMIVFVILITVTIVEGAKKLIINERISTIGTFFSQGAMKKNIRNILFMEGIIEGLIGGGLGLLIGYVFCLYINYENSPLKEYGVYEKITFVWYLLPVPLVFAVLISVSSCVIPFRQIKHMQVKEVILNQQNSITRKKSNYYILGVVLLVIGAVVAFINNSFAVLMSIPAFVFSFLGLILLYPKIVEWLNSSILKRMNGHGTLYVIINNMKSSKIIQTNIRLLLIAATALTLIFTISDSVQSGVVGIYSDLNYNVVCGYIDDISVDDILNKIRSLDYINKDRIVIDYSLEGKLNDKTYWIYGVDLDCYDEFNTYIDFKSGDAGEAYKILKNDPKNKIIISDEVARKLNLDENSKVDVCINGVNKEFGIAGIINTKMMNMGNGIYIDNNQVKNVFNISYPTGIYLSSNDLSEKELKYKLKNDIGCYGVSIQTKEENVEKDISQTRTLISNLKVFGLICLVMSLFGVLNNLAISFIQRKREIAILGSIGMTPKQRFGMLLGEAFFSSCWAAFFTISYLFLGANLCSKITRFIGLGLNTNIDKNQLLLYLAMIIITGSVPSILILLKNKKLTIINEIRYE